MPPKKKAKKVRRTYKKEFTKCLNKVFDLPDFKVKKVGKDLFFEGFSNRAVKQGNKVIDRGKEHIPGSAWRTAEYDANPVILFNHDPDFIAGKAVVTKATDKGLYQKILISDAPSERVQELRWNVANGFLKGLSVGIDVLNETPRDDGSVELDEVNLMETSLVTIPMNQESLGAATKKYSTKGAWVAGAVHFRLFELMKENPEFSRADALQEAAQSANVSLTEMFEVLAGNVIDIAPEVLDSFASTLGMDREQLTELNRGDVEVANQNQDRPDETIEEEEEGEVSEEENPEENPDENADEEPEENEEEMPEEELAEDTEQEDPDQAPPEEESEEDEEELAMGEDEEDDDENEEKQADQRGAEGDQESASDFDKPDDDQILESELPDEEDTAPDDQLNPPDLKSAQVQLSLALERIKNGEDQKTVMAELHSKWHELGNPCEDKDKENKDKDKEKQNTQTDSFRKCVAAKVKEALKGGKDQDAAIAFALNECRENKARKTLDASDWEYLFKEINNFSRQKVDGGGQPTPDDQDINNNNKTVIALQQLVNMQGQLIREFQELKEALVSTPTEPTMEDPEEELAMVGEEIPPESDEEKNEEDEELGEDETKALDTVQGYRQKLKEKLARF